MVLIFLFAIFAPDPSPMQPMPTTLGKTLICAGLVSQNRNILYNLYFNALQYLFIDFVFLSFGEEASC